MNTPHHTLPATGSPVPPSSDPASTDLPTPLWRLLAPICGMVFLQFFAMGLPLAVLPVHVAGVLGYSSLMVGIVVGAQSVVTLLTRHRSGTRTDTRGPRDAVTLGLRVSVASGVAYLAALSVRDATGALVLLLVARGLLGLGESLVIVGGLAWSMALAGRQRSGLVMAWVGIAMYGGIAAGAPVGTALTGLAGFRAAAVAATIVPLAGIPLARLARSVRVSPGPSATLRSITRSILLPGTALALATVSFGAIAGFSALMYEARGWSHSAAPLTAFGIAYIAARLLFGGLPDRFGGARVALGSIAVTALGQAAMWTAPSPGVAAAAAALTGAGFSLTFPSLGILAMEHVPPHNRGVALGAYVAFFDATMGLGIPALGAVVSTLGYRSAYLGGLLSAVASLTLVATPQVRAWRTSDGLATRALTTTGSAEAHFAITTEEA